MSARENQSLQIALIVLVMLTMVLGVTTYLFFHNYQEEQLRGAELAVKAKTAREEQAQTVAAWGRVRTFIAGPETDVPVEGGAEAGRVTDETERLARQFEQDMQKYGPDLAPLDKHRTYPFLVERYAGELDKKNGDYDTVKVALAKRIQAHEAELKANVQEREIYAAARAKINEDLVNVRQAFNADTEAKQARLEALAVAKNQAEQNLNAAQQATARQANELRKQIATLEKSLEEIAKRAKSTELHRSPQGNVVVINQANRTATINLGALDRLPVRTVFSVYGANESGTAKAKAQLEVIQIEADHVATCRILSDDMKNLMLPGDWVFSPIWQPGEVEHYALAGFFDIDGDGRSDRQLLVDLIAARGGVVDAQLNEEGRVQGTITFQTQFLIVADRMTTKAEKPEFLAGLTRLLNAGDKLGVRPISVSKFLTHVGYTRERVVKSGTLAVR